MNTANESMRPKNHWLHCSNVNLFLISSPNETRNIMSSEESEKITKKISERDQNEKNPF